MIMSGDYVTPESGTFFTHEQGRSLTEAGLDIACFLFVCFLFCSYFAETVRQTWGQAGRGSVVCISTNHSEYLGDLSVKGEHFERTSPHCATSHDVWWRPKKECLFFSLCNEVLVDMMTELQSECYVAGFSETQNSNIFQYSVTSVKDKLLEDWVLL